MWVRSACPCLVCLTLWAAAVCVWLLQAMRMWARLQGVGISVRADTALPWPLLLLHKASQPALSPGLESVSAATCQIKTKKRGKKKTNPVPPVLSLCHQPFFSTSGSLFFCLIANYRCACGKTITPHNLLLNMPASLTTNVCHSLGYLVSSRAIYHH